MENLRLVRVFGNGITPSTEKAYRVESVNLTSEHDALTLVNDLNSWENSREFRLVRVFGHGTRVSAAESFRAETVEILSERDALLLMRNLNSPYMGSRYLVNSTSVSNGTRVSNEDQQQQG